MEQRQLSREYIRKPIKSHAVSRERAPRSTYFFRESGFNLAGKTCSEKNAAIKLIEKNSCLFHASGMSRILLALRG